MADSTTGTHVQNVQNPSMATKEKKRSRVQLSCTACRSRKGEAASCTFVGRGPRGRSSQGRTSPTLVQDRLQHLENLILSFTQKKSSEQSQASSASEKQNIPSRKGGSVVPAVLQNPSSSIEPEPRGTAPESTGRLLENEAGPSYFDGAHWRAILEEVNEVKGYFQQETDEESEEEIIDDDFFDSSSPALLLGLNKPASKEEILADIPPRPVADRLVSQLLHCKEPLLVVLHFPTFQKEGVSLEWLGVLYAIFTLAISVLDTIEEPVPQSLGDHLIATTRFRKRTVQCLVQANYITPGRYKVEALFLYTMGEFFTSCDAQAGVSFMLGLTIRLAMRMGYHRDPRNFPKMSAYEGEMRRRLWTVLSQLDTLISFQVGLPRTIQAWQHDVELPRNLFDEDYDENTKELPPSRPETERTPLCYTRAKGRIMSVFGRISDLAYSREPVTYEQTLEIDRHLEEAHDQIPPILRIRPMEQSITDQSELILKRLTLEVLYQKCRCVLHRRYLAEFHDNMRYTYSRWVCMTAAKQILRHQADLHQEIQPGGQLYRERQFPNSIQNTDYLLAAMIICLELSPGHPTEPGTNSQCNDVTVIIKGREDLLSALESTHQIFKDMRRRSADAQKAYAAMSIMLRCVKKSTQHAVDSTSGSSGQEFNTTSDVSPPPYDGWHNQQGPPSVLAHDQINAIQPPFTSLDVIEEMLDAPTNLDWRLWDQQIQGFEDENVHTLWYPGLEP
ncbi:hypothetical protein Asppvi_008717 [Aspergillus pseudoviridinutans]|uniref:Xylanolytic transcriptional activator regulatory domain-containing protein n=1 Tax=Aspergillus pseudoviridinutans TaxID=1517512 RepID=A0A9P3BEL0_9EURO|nr:uncharacterized protein Asppvi_008717 [Aspergillus pseudoviridinutans]GIJ89772.1 hypothetical protein Asppvi_008717 [Aspergillus pseudoviridinutans]